MKFIYHKFKLQETTRNDRIDFSDDFGNSMRMYKRIYNNNGAYFYMYSHVFPTLFIYSGGFIGQLYDYCQKVKDKCTGNSIVAAFSDCPYIYKLITDDKFDNCHLEDISINGEKKKCLAVCYCSLFLDKETMYYRLSKMEDALKKEISLIRNNELKGKWDSLKKFGAGALKVIAKVGVALVAGAVGANIDIDIPDFDFGFTMPDFDFDVDFDADLDADCDVANFNMDNNDIQNSADIIPDGDNSISNITFGAHVDGGNYFDTGKDITVYGESGAKIGTFDVVLHNGQKGIIKDGTWFKILGNRIGTHFWTK